MGQIDDVMAAVSKATEVSVSGQLGFSTPSDQHFVKTALAFWFEDEDYAKSDKIWNYFN